MIKAPIISKLKSFDFPPVRKLSLPNGIPLYNLDTHNEDVFKMDICFQGGRMGESQKLSSRACAYLIREGTKNYTSTEIANKTDYFGATILSKSGMDYNTLSLYCLKRQLPHLLPIVLDILMNAFIDEDDFQRYIRTQKQHLKLRLSKNDIIAYREFSRDLMGENHPYGYNSSPEYFDQLDINSVMQFYIDHYTAGNARAYVSCKWDDGTSELLNAYLGQIPKGQKKKFSQIETPAPSFHRKDITGPQAMQTAIRIGKTLFSRNHPDYCHFYVLNTVLGGYFGSRLMENIRENKGYSYGIYSSHDTMRYNGFFSIATECNTEFKDQCLVEIKKEIQKLRENLVPVEELTMVKNYLIGNFMSMVDGPFNTLSVLKTLINSTGDIEIFDKMLDAIYSSNSAKLREMAVKHLDPEKMLYVCVG